METKPPPKVYKYYAPNDYNKDALRNGYFWFSKRKYLNDPYDSHGEIINEYPRFCTELRKTGRDVDNYTDLLEHFGICCFTEDPYNAPMWASYAENHTGWCLEFDTTQIIDGATECVAPQVYKAHYLPQDDSFIDLDDFETPILLDSKHSKCVLGILRDCKDTEKLFALILSTKAFAWNYEKEYRIILGTLYLNCKGRNQDNGYKIKWNQGKLKRIIIGCNTPPDIRSFLCDMARSYGVNVYQIKANNPKQMQFGMELYFSSTECK